MSARNLLGISVLLMIAVGTGYMARSLQKSDAPLRRTQIVKNGFYVKSARILGTADDGRLLYEIEAEYAEQQENDEIEFQNVRVRYTTETAVPWVLIADKAVIGNDRDLVTLSGHVIAISDAGFSGDTTEIRTELLELQPDAFKAETDSRVQIRIGSRSLTATGMLAMLQSNQLQLKSNVSGKFVR